MRGGDPRAHSVLVAFAHFERRQLREVLDWFGDIAGNAAVIGEHRRQLEVAEMHLQERVLIHHGLASESVARS